MSEGFESQLQRLSKLPKCPECSYYLADTADPNVFHCYNCDEDLPITFDGYQDAVIIEDVEKWLNEPPPGDPAYDSGSLSAALTEGDLTVTEMKRITDGGGATGSTPNLFPYSLDDLKYWIIKRKTGEIVKFTLVSEPGVPGIEKGGHRTNYTSAEKSTTRTAYSSLGDWCKHDPAPDPVFAFPGGELKGFTGKLNPINLFIADCAGARAHKEKFDFCIDGGDVIADLYATRNPSILSGDQDLVDSLDTHTLAELKGPRVLKIAWSDRRAPLLHPSFWPDLATKLSGDVLTICMGGHGRSGTSLVCLMMVLNPEYGAADAITHLRAIHCPRAIESYEQHGYIDEVAEYLGRAHDSSKVHEITNFKEAFLKLDKASAKPYQDRLRKEMEK